MSRTELRQPPKDEADARREALAVEWAELRRKTRAVEGELFGELGKLVAGTVNQALPHLDANERDDVRQEVWISLLKELPGYDPAKSSLKSWLIGTTKRRTIDVLRLRLGRSETGRAARKRVRGVSLDQARDEEGMPLADLIADEESPEERARAVYRLLEPLPRCDRLPYALYFAHGWTLQEIGEATGLCESRISQFFSQRLPKLGRYWRAIEQGEGPTVVFLPQFKDATAAVAAEQAAEEASPPKEPHPNARIDREKARRIFLAKGSTASVARRENVAYGLAYGIRRRLTWKEATADLAANARREEAVG